MKTDAELQRDVMNELQWEPTMRAAEIGVSVMDGVVTLSGHVESFNKKSAAKRAAWRVFGVKAVAEELKVRLLGSLKWSDEDIARAVANVLECSSGMPWCPMTASKCTCGMGSVRSLAEIEETKRAAWAIPGVPEVDNNIKICP